MSASINLEPDGRFPAHVPNPEDKAAVAATREAVLSSGADRDSRWTLTLTAPGW